MEASSLSVRRLKLPSAAPNEPATGFSIVCLSTQEWDVDLPTNRQQVMARAAASGHHILFVETGHFLGTHLWRLLLAGRRRSLARRLLAGESVGARVSARKALNIFPWRQRYGLANAMDCRLTAAILRRAARRLPKPVVLWIYDPCSARLAKSCGEVFAVYDCVDDYAEQAGSDLHRRALVAREDERAASTARLVFATTQDLYRRKRRLNSNTHLVPNAGDFPHFLQASDPDFQAAEIRNLTRPVLGFAGNLLRSKVDFELLEEVAAARADWTVLLIGPARPDSAEALTRLTRLANVRWVGLKPYAELPAYVAAFDVGLIPYRANEYTRNCSPLKLYEYLAAGKPVVASGLPVLAGMEPDVVLAEGADDFISAVEAALAARGSEDRKRRMALAAENTWERRTERLLELVGEELRSAS
jgi:glycosyltransferase involved in cell wall biosynthesis